MPGANWEAAMIRAALFTQKAAPLSLDLFSAFAGEPPDQVEDRPKEGVRRQSGLLEGAELRTGLMPMMAEFLLVPPTPTAEQMLGEFPTTTGDLKAELAKFERRLMAWLPKWQEPTIRVALVVQARVPAASVAAAYEILRENLTSVSVKPGAMSDLIYRVNWKVKSAATVEGYLNRITSWSALQLRIMGTSASAGAPEMPLKTRDYAQVEMDINSPAEHKEPLPPERIGTIYTELFQLVVEIADHGEPS